MRKRQKSKEFRQMAITAYNNIVEVCEKLENDYTAEEAMDDLGLAATGFAEWLESLGVTVPQDDEGRVMVVPDVR